MKLSEFNSVSEKIYIDANIFLYVMLNHPSYLQPCKNFLLKIEKGQLNAVISPLVIDEVTFKIIVEKLKEVLSIDSNAKILQMLKKDSRLLNLAKPELMTFLFILKGYKGLKLISAISTTGLKIFHHILKDNLLPRDAAHLAILNHYGIKHIATNDSDFERIASLHVYKP